MLFRDFVINIVYEGVDFFVEYDTNGTWFLYPASSTGEYIKTLSMDYVVITKDMKEFAMVFDDGKIVATSNEIYKQLIDEMSRVHES